MRSVRVRPSGATESRNFATKPYIVERCFFGLGLGGFEFVYGVVGLVF